MEIQNAKGSKEYPPEEKILRDKVVRTLIETFERYGFPPLETPTLQRYDLLAEKYAGGSEILKETFKLDDQGGRKLALRYDLTVPMCLFVGMNPMMKLPFKRYEVGKVYRDGPIKAGRLREFWQCDADVVGPAGAIADAESILLMADAFESLGLSVIIELNNRKILDGLMETLSISEDKRIEVITAIDKLKKVPIKDIEKELEQKGIEKEQAERLLKTFKVVGTNKEKITALRKIMSSDKGKEGLQEIEEILEIVQNSKTKGESEVQFSPSLARGLVYYTGPVWEAFLKDGSFSSSLAGAGRYDKIIGDFLGGSRVFPATGLSFGIEPIMVVLSKKRQQKKSVAQMYIAPIGTQKESMAIAQELRQQGMKVDIDLMCRGPSKNLDYARALGIPYVLFIGEDELKKKKFKLKDMEAGKEESLAIKEIVKKFV